MCFLSEMKSYRSLQFNKCFGEPAAAGDLKLPDNYNGAGKAVWVDLSGEQDTEWNQFHGEKVKEYLAGAD